MQDYLHNKFDKQLQVYVEHRLIFSIYDTTVISIDPTAEIFEFWLEILIDIL